MSIHVFVEGGGEQRALLAECRRGFSELFRKAVPAGRQPRVIACGGRDATFKKFCAALGDGERAMALLLVDAEGPVTAPPWEHLRMRDGWKRPANAADDQAHLMVQCMEAWFLADRPALLAYYGQGFHESALPRRTEIEEIAKDDLFKALAAATREARTKGRYGKGSHSFELLSRIDPGKVRAASPHADRLLHALSR